ncbi:hypothetical protein VPH35_128152 [Triticum aestivum]
MMVGSGHHCPLARPPPPDPGRDGHQCGPKTGGSGSHWPPDRPSSRGPAMRHPTRPATSCPHHPIHGGALRVWISTGWRSSMLLPPMVEHTGVWFHLTDSMALRDAFQFHGANQA